MNVKDKSAVMGKVTSVYGVKGWVKVMSFTQPKENISQYKNWVLDHSGERITVKVSHCKPHANGLIAQLDGCSDRELAKQYCGSLITVSQSELPELSNGEFYWHQLEDLRVVTVEDMLLGKVSHLIETGSNDVLVIKKCEGSIDGRERMVPYLPDQVVKKIDLDAGLIEVEWDPDF